MIAQIIPALRLPRTTESFFYSVPLVMQKNIQAGQIIAVNFRNKNIPGLIVKIDKDKKFKYPLKSINKILYAQPLVTQQQIKLIDYMATYYAVAKSIVVKSMLPDVPKRQNPKPKTQSRVLGTKHKNGKYKKELLWYQDKNELFKYISKKVSHNLKNKKQILLLVPQIELIDKIIKQLQPKADPCLPASPNRGEPAGTAPRAENLNAQQVIKIHNQIAKTKFFQSWLEILAGQAKIIIGTRISVLLPFSNLGEIIIYHQHDWDHKQSDINPRYDARQMADWLANQHGCQLTLTTPAPSVESYYKNISARPYLASRRVAGGKNTTVKIVDFKQERLKGNYSMLSDELIEGIKGAKKIFIFHNRKGLANFVICQDCGYIFKCPECEISLAYHADDKKLRCHSCNYILDSPPLCPKCQGPNIKFKSQGIERIKLEMQKEFTHAKIFSLSKETKGWKNETIEKHNIVIGTEFVMNKIDFNAFDLIGFINFDQLLNRPDFRSQEMAYQLFHEIKSAAPHAEFIIQTYEAENIVLKSIAQNKPELFYKSELANRQELNYPPWAKIIKLTYQDIKEKKVVAETNRLVLNLKKSFKSIEILGPLENYPKKVRNKFKSHVIIKTKPNYPMQKIIKSIPNNFLIDVEPEKLA